jgi:hypothetical protein
MQILQQPHQVTILYDENHQFRQVRLNEPHPPNVKPYWHGDSVGHYEGDTLTDTVALKTDRPFAMIDLFGTPYTKGVARDRALPAPWWRSACSPACSSASGPD